MIRSDVFFLCEKYFSDDVLRGKRLSEIDNVYLHSGAKVLPFCCHLSIFMSSEKVKKPPCGGLFFFLTHCFISEFYLVPRAGLEPAQPYSRGILNPLCLPISPPGLNMEARPGVEPRLTDLQSAAWPLCQRALISATNRPTD